MILDAEKMSTMFESMMMQNEKIDEMDRKLTNLINSVQKLTKLVISNPNKNSNCNVRTVTGIPLNSPEIQRDEKLNQLRYAKKKTKYFSRRFASRDIKSSDLIYMNEKTNQSFSHPIEASSAHLSNTLELIDLEQLNDDD